MSEDQPKEVVTKERLYSISNALKAAFDLSSGGIGVMSQSLVDLDLNTTISETSYKCLIDAKSNFLTQSYVFGWGGSIDDDKPLFLSPLSDKHLELFRQMRQEYARLGRRALRYFFGEEQTVEDFANGDPESPIQKSELKRIVEIARDKGIVKKAPDEVPDLDDYTDDEFDLWKMLDSKGIEIDMDAWDRLYKFKFSKEPKPQLRKAATYKLGCMLALIEQLTFEAKALRNPIPDNFKPYEDLPDLLHVYQEAFGVFTQRVGDNDTASYLLAFPTLPHR